MWSIERNMGRVWWHTWQCHPCMCHPKFITINYFRLLNSQSTIKKPGPHSECMCLCCVQLSRIDKHLWSLARYNAHVRGYYIPLREVRVPPQTQARTPHFAPIKARRFSIHMGRKNFVWKMQHHFNVDFMYLRTHPLQKTEAWGEINCLDIYLGLSKIRQHKLLHIRIVKTRLGT